MQRTARRLRWLGPALAAVLGCQAPRPAAPAVAPPSRVSLLPPQPLRHHQPVIQARAQLAAPEPPAPPNVVPISLDAVFRLAQDRNGQVQLARARLDEAFADQDLARKAWIPRLTVGPSYYRHEGGIQDVQGNLVHSSYGSWFGGMNLNGRLDPRDVVFQRVEAERKIWQQKGELSKLTSENLLDAAGTYVDLLAARASEAVSREIEKHITDLLEQTRGLVKVDPGARVELTRVEADLAQHKIQARKLRAGDAAAAAKLAYLLGLDPAAELAPIELHLPPLRLVDAGLPVDTLVGQALAAGPGVREMEGLLRLIEETRAKAEGPGRFVPALQVTALEGAFGAGPGSRTAWDNRFDLGMNLRWNLTDALTARERRRQADVKMLQAHLGYHDLRDRLTLGVREAREAIQSGQDQLQLARAQIRHAEAAFELSRSRFKESIKGRSPSEVLLALRALGGARLQYVQAVRDLDKAQLRLFVLTGAACQGAPDH
jgi:outer membrane protein TolC